MLSKSGSPFLIPGCLLAVDEVIVDGNGHGPQTVDAQLHRQPLGKRGLARGRRPGDQAPLDLIPVFVNMIGDPGDLLLVERLGDLDEIADLPRRNDLVQPAHRVDAENAAPLLVLLKNLEQLRLRLKRRQRFGIRLLGNLQYKTGRVRNQLEQRQRARARGQRSVREIGKILAPPRGDLGRVAKTQEVVFVPLFLLFEPLNRLRKRDLAHLDGNVPLNHGPHPLVDALQLLVADARLALHLETAEKTRAQRVLDRKMSVREQFLDCLRQ